MADQYYLGENHIINLEHIVGVEVLRSYDYSEIKQANIYIGGAQINVYEAEAIKFWDVYSAYAQERNEQE